MMLADSRRSKPATLCNPTPTGLEIAGDLSFDEWAAIGSSFGAALQTAAWCIGDWLVYGERKWGRQLILPGEDFDGKAGRIPSEIYDRALASTRLDRATLQSYASICRAIERPKRLESLTFAHHRLLAPLKPEKRDEWMAILDFESKNDAVPTVKRLALSIRIAAEDPRIVSDEEIMSRGKHAGHDNYVPHLMRLLTILRQTIPQMDQRQRAALKADTAQLREILNAL